MQCWVIWFKETEYHPQTYERMYLRITSIVCMYWLALCLWDGSNRLTWEILFLCCFSELSLYSTQLQIKTWEFFSVTHSLSFLNNDFCGLKPINQFLMEIRPKSATKLMLHIIAIFCTTSVINLRFPTSTSRLQPYYCESFARNVKDLFEVFILPFLFTDCNQRLQGMKEGES